MLIVNDERIFIFPFKILLTNNLIFYCVQLSIVIFWCLNIFFSVYNFTGTTWQLCWVFSQRHSVEIPTQECRVPRTMSHSIGFVDLLIYVVSCKNHLKVPLNLFLNFDGTGYINVNLVSLDKPNRDDFEDNTMRILLVVYFSNQKPPGCKIY